MSTSTNSGLPEDASSRPRTVTTFLDILNLLLSIGELLSFFTIPMYSSGCNDVNNIRSLCRYSCQIFKELQIPYMVIYVTKKKKLDEVKDLCTQNRVYHLGIFSNGNDIVFETLAFCQSVRSITLNAIRFTMKSIVIPSHVLFFTISNCDSIECISGNNTCLISLNITHCNNLKLLFNVQTIKFFRIVECSSIGIVPFFPCIIHLEIESCNFEDMTPFRNASVVILVDFGVKNDNNNDDDEDDEDDDDDDEQEDEKVNIDFSKFFNIRYIEVRCCNIGVVLGEISPKSVHLDDIAGDQDVSFLSHADEVSLSLLTVVPNSIYSLFSVKRLSLFNVDELTDKDVYILNFLRRVYGLSSCGHISQPEDEVRAELRVNDYLEITDKIEFLFTAQHITAEIKEHLLNGVQKLREEDQNS